MELNYKIQIYPFFSKNLKLFFQLPIIDNLCFNIITKKGNNAKINLAA